MNRFFSILCSHCNIDIVENANIIWDTATVASADKWTGQWICKQATWFIAARHDLRRAEYPDTDSLFPVHGDVWSKASESSFNLKWVGLWLKGSLIFMRDQINIIVKYMIWYYIYMLKGQNYVINYLRSPNQLFSFKTVLYFWDIHTLFVYEGNQRKKNYLYNFSVFFFARSANFIAEFFFFLFFSATLAQFFFSLCLHFSHIICSFSRVKLLWSWPYHEKESHRKLN